MTCTRPLLFALTASLAAACSEPTSPPDNVSVIPATVVVSEDTVIGTRRTNSPHEYISFNATVQVTNIGAETLHLRSCSTWLEEKRDGKWIAVSENIGFTSCDGPTIAPGRTEEVSRTVIAETLGEGRSGETVIGEFRYRVGLTWTGLQGIIPNPASNSFIVVVRD